MGRFLLVLATREEGETVSDFMQWWRSHAQTAAQIPGLEAYRLFEVATATGRSELPWDGFSLLEFAPGVDAMEQLLHSEEGKAAMQETAGRGGRRLFLLSDTVDVILPVEDKD